MECHFAGIERADDTIPDESTILRFRHLPGKARYRGLYKTTVRALGLLASVNLYLARRRLLPRGDRFAL